MTGGRRRLVALGLAAGVVAVAVALAVMLSSVPQAGGPPSFASSAQSTAKQPASTPPVAAPPPDPASPADPGTPEPTVPGAPGEQVPVAPGPTPPPETLPAPQPPPPAAPFPAGLLGQDLEVLPGAGPVVALTFDAGGNSAGLPVILQTLADAGIHGTFFLTGAWAAANPAGVAAIVAGGHRVGNHSLTHPAFTGLPDTGIADQVLGAQQAIQAAGADPRPLFRFPLGDRDARTIAAINSLGYVAVRWTVDTLGWKGTSGGISARQVADRALSGLRPGEIVLMHVGSNPDDASALDAEALPDVINRIRQAGYGFATLDSLLAG